MCDDDPVSMMFQWIVTAVLINVKSSILYSITGMKIMDILTVGRFIYFFFFLQGNYSHFNLVSFRIAKEFVESSQILG